MHPNEDQSDGCTFHSSLSCVAVVVVCLSVSVLFDRRSRNHLRRIIYTLRYEIGEQVSFFFSLSSYFIQYSFARADAEEEKTISTNLASAIRQAVLYVVLNRTIVQEFVEHDYMTILFFLSFHFQRTLDRQTNGFRF